MCRDCGKYFLGDATYHHHSRKSREEALRMYANGMSMRAISRVFNVPLGTVFTWIKRYGRKSMRSWLSCGVGLRSWSRVRLLMRCGLTCTRAFYKWVFTRYVYTKLGVYLILGDRGERTFLEVKKYLPEEG